MANRVLVATLYSGPNNLCFLNMRPNDIYLNGGDEVYLVVEPGNVCRPYGQIQYNFKLHTPKAGKPIQQPFRNEPGSSNLYAFGELIHLGTVKGNPDSSYVQFSYTMTITHNGNEYAEDPKIRINPQG